MDCGILKTNKFWRENRCNNVVNPYLNYWNREKFCGLTCYEIGQGYDDYPYSDCCNGISADDNACNMDVKTCCNGDKVGRTGPSCKYRVIVSLLVLEYDCLDLSTRHNESKPHNFTSLVLANM